MLYEGALTAIVTVALVAATVAVVATVYTCQAGDYEQQTVYAANVGWQIRMDAQLSEAERLTDKLLEEARRRANRPAQ